MRKVLCLLAAALMLTSCGADAAIQSTTPAAEVDPGTIELPDLSAFGIDTAEFRLVDERYEQEYAADAEIDGAGRYLTDSWYQFQNNAGATLCYDKYGRLRKFINAQEIAVKFKNRAENAMPDDEMLAIANQVLQTVLPEYASYVQMDSTVVNAQIGSLYYPCELFMRNGSMDEKASNVASVQLNTDGSIRTFGVTYNDIAPGASYSALDRKAKEVSKKITCGKRDVELEYCLSLDGVVYGVYLVRSYTTATDNLGNQETFTDLDTIVVRQP
jgi:hypothetical protein